MKKLNKLAVVVFAVAGMLLCGQSVFASGRYENGVIEEDTTVGAGKEFKDYHENAGSGGVFIVEKPVTLTIENGVSFKNNSAYPKGGAIYIDSGTVNISNNVSFYSNTANICGAIYKEKGTLTIGDNAEFKNNMAKFGYGGAICNDDGITRIGSNALFEGNQAMTNGGAICKAKGTIIIGNNSIFKNNMAEHGPGGAIYNGNGIFNIGSNAKFTGNMAIYGGAISVGGTVTIQDGATFKDNMANGEGGAIVNPGTLNLIAKTNNVEFTGNKQYAGTEKEESNAIYDDEGEINLWAGSASIIFNDRIVSKNSSSTLNINQVHGKLPTTGKVVLNEDMSGYTGTVNFYDGTIELGENGKWFGGEVNVDVDNATINLANGLVENHKFNKVNVSGNLNLSVDADLRNKKMDTITISSTTNFSGDSKVTVSKVKIIKDTKEKEVSLTFANDKLKNKVEFNGNAEGLLYKYDTTYDNTTCKFTFVNSGVNMETAAGAVASSVGGYATQSVVINQAFAGINRQMAQKVQPKTVSPKATVKPSQESSVTPADKKEPAKTNGKQNKKSANINFSKLYVSAGNQIFDDSGKIERSLWLRPFALQETIKLNGVDIDNTLYGTLAGIDFIANQDSSIMTSFYIGYAGSKQKFDETKTNQTGYLVGLTGMLIKEKWYLGATVNGIFNKVSADSEDETNDFDMNMFTIGAKAGYNIDLSDKWILEPNITVMYGIANSDSYQTSLGSIDSQSTSNILVEPQVKAKWQLTNGWQPYGLVGYSANLSGKPKVKAGGEELELDSIDGFVEYGIGVNKEFIGSVWSCYGQVTGRSGGRNGFGGNLGIKYKF